MTVMDSFFSHDLGLVVTGVVASGQVKAGDALTVLEQGRQFDCVVKWVARPGMEVFAVGQFIEWICWFGHS